MAFYLSLTYVLLIFLSPGDFVPALAPFRVQLVLFLLALAASFPLLISPDFRPPVPAFPLMLGFIASILFSLVMQGWLGGLPIALQRFLPSAAAFFLLCLHTNTFRRLRVVQVSLVLAASYLSTRAILAFQEGDRDSLFIAWVHEGGGEFRPRLRALGILGDPNDFAQFLLMMVPLAALSWRKYRTAWNLATVGLPIVLFFSAIYFTRSRGALVGAVVMAAVAAEERLGKTAGALATVPAALVLLALNFTGGRSISLSSGADRLDLWSEGLQLVKSSPLWGVGYGNFTEYSTHVAHNSFLQCAAELGLPGYFLWLGLFVVVLTQLQNILDAPREEAPTPAVRRQASALRVMLWGFLATSWFLSRAYRATPFIAVALATVIAQLDWKRRRSPLLPPDREWMTRTLVIGLCLLVAIYAMVRMERLVS
jgi:putative inorganic carbon (hco3(-)) transporter